jgi:DNA (cytosine-5)-methyltransferase 1
MTALSLFTGIGGLDLAAEAVGIDIIAMCEIDEYCGKILGKRWTNVPIFKDVFLLNKSELERRGVISDSKTIDIIFGGFPLSAVFSRRFSKRTKRPTLSLS